jgi:cytochrome b561
LADTDGYSLISRVNHWIVAIGMIGMLGFGLYLSFGGLEREAKGPLVSIHRSLGVLILIFGSWRILWRIFQRFPSPATAMPAWQERVSKITHCCLLVGIFLMPASGIASTVFRGRSVDVFGWYAIPAQTEVPWIVGTASFIHTYLGYFLVALIVLHIGAALKHHFVDRDSTLRRMISGA